MRAFPRASSLALLALLAPLAPAAAFAAAATTSQTVNLRAGPAASYDVTGQLQAGQAVDVRQCEGTFCQISYDGKTGWISASFLTRGTTTATTSAIAPAAPQVAAATPHKPTPVASALPAVLPPAYTTPPSTAPAEPQIAAVTPHRPKPVAPTVVPRPYTTAPASVLPPADTADASADSGAPRPKVDVPGDALGAPGDDNEIASADDFGDDALARDDGSDDDAMAPPPRFGPRGFGPRGFRRAYAGLDIGGARACLVEADGGNGFCVREGEKIAYPGRWSRNAMLLRNPQHLNVTVCAAPDDCYTYASSGPVLVGGRPIASISVAAPGY